MAEKDSAGPTALASSPLTIKTTSLSSTEVDTYIQAPNCGYFNQNLNPTDWGFFRGGFYGFGVGIFFIFHFINKVSIACRLLQTKEAHLRRFWE